VNAYKDFDKTGGKIPTTDSAVQNLYRKVYSVEFDQMQASIAKTCIRQKSTGISRAVFPVFA